ncbi:hypothetical protein AB205_0186080 [Aquarana catesbeiana]|uniref:Uncharacterized protein n=1 Tax=Aquarana catesbeiana TaxID=8400 RepID=A0A2G9P8C9_AQUCT|nr:hypothetical protein AB205_0186080 [Aquarana catesbeiana]
MKITKSSVPNSTNIENLTWVCISRRSGKHCPNKNYNVSVFLRIAKPKFEDAHKLCLNILISLMIPCLKCVYFHTSSLLKPQNTQCVNMCYLPSLGINGHILGVQPLPHN